MTTTYAEIKGKLKTKEDKLFFENSPFSGVLKKEEDGSVSEKNYNNGLLHGIQKSYHDNGKLKWITMYTNGSENGRRIEYYPCGAKKMNANYCDGTIDGIYEEWDTNGILIMRKTFFKGKLIAIKSN